MNDNEKNKINSNCIYNLKNIIDDEFKDRIISNSLYDNFYNKNSTEKRIHGANRFSIRRLTVVASILLGIFLVSMAPRYFSAMYKSPSTPEVTSGFISHGPIYIVGQGPKLFLNITSNKAEYMPGDTVTLTLSFKQEIADDKIIPVNETTLKFFKYDYESDSNVQRRIDLDDPKPITIKELSDVEISNSTIIQDMTYKFTAPTQPGKYYIEGSLSRQGKTSDGPYSFNVLYPENSQLNGTINIGKTVEADKMPVYFDNIVFDNKSVTVNYKLEDNDPKFDSHIAFRIYDPDSNFTPITIQSIFNDQNKLTFNPDETKKFAPFPKTTKRIIIEIYGISLEDGNNFNWRHGSWKLEIPIDFN